MLDTKKLDTTIRKLQETRELAAKEAERRKKRDMAILQLTQMTNRAVVRITAHAPPA